MKQIDLLLRQQLCYHHLFIFARFASAREFSYIFPYNRSFSSIGPQIALSRDDY